MKTVKLNSAKLQLKKVKIASLTKEEMTKVQGGGLPNMTSVGKAFCNYSTAG